MPYSNALLRLSGGQVTVTVARVSVLNNRLVVTGTVLGYTRLRGLPERSARHA